ncbi:hypothetical protein [Cellulomonas pakistanensis]|uniref:Uncharacterized protein n=1 Tax=Cellulomonas pakistanensis TaxID=992287 RepID=A0A919U3D8_9CELL|nr:hypothetical protein [Cellulomonas pakistanensis]GIG36191.1 hypothetical protein Cpa01nite_15720 [Cellulomonas pakistanensis]
MADPAAPAGAHPSRVPRVPWPWLVAAAGLVLTALGVWLLTRPQGAWFAYAPLSDATYVPARPSWAGIVALGAGCAAWGGSLGHVLARRAAWRREGR